MAVLTGEIMGGFYPSLCPKFLLRIALYNSVIFFILKEIIKDNTDFLSKYSVGIYIFFPM